MTTAYGAGADAGVSRSPVTAPADWLNVIRREYLETFVRDGGSAVKIAVPRDAQARDAAADGLVRSGQELGFLVVQVSAADTRVHMMDRLFFEIADQIPWRTLSEQVVVRIASEKMFAVPQDGDGSLLDRLAEANSLGANFLLSELLPAIEDGVAKNRRLSRDFRVAVTHLCLSELRGGADGERRIQAIIEWLDGSNNRVSAVRPYHIFSRITRANARYLFESMLHWLRFAGYSGLLLVLDTARLTVARNPRDGKQYYTKAALLDAYEVLRQFIDATDRLHGCLIVVVPDAEFLADDQSPRSRGIGAYEALKLRVIDEVRDRRLANPMASLVRLSSMAQV